MSHINVGQWDEAITTAWKAGTRIAELDIKTGLVTVSDDSGPRYVMPHAAYLDLLDDMKLRGFDRLSPTWQRYASAAASADLLPLRDAHSRLEFGLLRWWLCCDRVTYQASAVRIRGALS